MKHYEINSIETLKEFFTDLIVKHKIDFHPDDPFEDYEEADYHNQVMEHAFNFCDDNDLDIYEVTLEVVKSIQTKQNLKS